MTDARRFAFAAVLVAFAVVTTALGSHARDIPPEGAAAGRGHRPIGAPWPSRTDATRAGVSDAVVDQIGGAVQAVHIVGDTAYVGIGPRVVALDISDPSHPLELGRGPVHPGLVNGIDVVGDLAFATAGVRGGLRVLDVSAPESIREVGALDGIGGANDVRVVGTDALIAIGDVTDGDRAGALVVIDVSHPSAPRKSGELRGMPWAASVAARGSVAFVTSSAYRTLPMPDDRGRQIYKPGDGSIWLVDVSDRTRPRKLSEIAPPRRTTVAAAAISGDHLYYVTGLSSDPEEHRDVDGLWVYDVSDPASPVDVAHVPVAWQGCLGAAVRASSLYALCDRLVVFDVADPTSPVRVSEARPPGWLSANRFAWTPENRLFLAGTDSGLHAFDVGDPAAPFPVSTYRGVGPVRLSAAAGRVVAAVETGGDIAVVSRSPDGAELASRIDSAAAPSDLLLVDGRLQLVYFDAAAWGARPGLNVYDLADPAHPVHVGQAPIDTSLQSVTAIGDRSYVAGYRRLDRSGGGFRPTFALELAEIDTGTVPPEVVSTTPITRCRQDRTLGGYRQHVGASSGHVLLSLFECELDAYRTSPTSPPRLVGSADTRNLPLVSPAVVAGESALVSLGHALAAVDVGDVTEPRLIGQTDPWTSSNYVPNEGRVVAVHGDRAFVADLGDVIVVDIADPSAPAALGRLETPGRAVGVAQEGDRLFVADSRGGLVVLDPSAAVEPLDPDGSTPTPERPTPVSTASPVPTTPSSDRPWTVSLPFVVR